MTARRTVPQLCFTLYRFRSGSVLGELGDANYIASAVMYFISENARWTTGVLMSVDGGYTL